MRRQQLFVLTTAIALGASAGLTGCSYDDHEMEQSRAWMGIHRATAAVQPTEGSKVAGTVTFEDVSGGVRVHAEITGLTPNSRHGFHIHQYGYCGSSDALCTGGHFDPANTNHHALPGAGERHHAGDMGNLEADANGKATYDAVIKGLSVAGEHGVLGRAVIIHANPDDGGQPTGNAGGRIGVATIGIAQPDK